MTTAILWIFLMLATGMEQPGGVIAESEARCKEMREEIIAYATTQSIQILAISDCTPVQLKTKP